MATAATIDLTELEKDPRLFLYTSLTAGSSHIVTATSRMETILRANKIPFQAIDMATDEKARRLWQRRAGKRKLPGLVKEGFVLGDLDEIEEWNEFGELKENIGPPPPSNAAPPGGQQGVNIAPPSLVAAGLSPGNTQVPQTPASGSSKSPAPLLDSSKMVALPGAAEIAARNAKQEESTTMITPSDPEAETPAPVEKETSIETAKEAPKHHPAIDHLSAPASRLQSGTATPDPEPIASSAGEENVASGTAASAVHNTQAEEVPKHHPAIDHLSVPASRLQSGTATPDPVPIASSGVEENVASGSAASAVHNAKAEEVHHGSEGVAKKTEEIAVGENLASGSAKSAVNHAAADEDVSKKTEESAAEENLASGSAASPVYNAKAEEVHHGSEGVAKKTEESAAEEDSASGSAALAVHNAKVEEFHYGIEGVAKKIEGLQLGEAAKTQEQSAATGEDAGKSVED